MFDHIPKNMIASKTSFGWPDQLKFAELSGDYNPMHLDAIVARRLIFGGVVVHGVHILLKALEWVSSERNANFVIRSVAAQFQQPVLVGADVEFRISETDTDKNESLVLAYVGTGVVARICINWTSDHGSPAEPANGLPEKESCLKLTEDEMPAARGQVPLTLSDDLLAELFPVLNRHVQRGQIATLLATTRIVGMKCPGYNSIFSELKISFSVNEKESRSLDFVVDQYDSRFHLASLKVIGAGAEGILKAFLRPPAQVQPTVSQLSQFVRDGEFSGKRALIIGGSRGLGELCAKLLAVGGADVRLTYRRGESDAAAVVNDIEASGGSALAHKFDVTDGGDVLLKELGNWRPTDLLYLATPAIFRTQHEGFSARLFDEFTDIYVKSFAEIFFTIAENGVLNYVLQPSTVAIDEVTRGMPEYIAAKVASEALCQYLEKMYPRIRFDVPRLPRMPTDQTVNLFGIKAADPIPLMLGFLRNNGSR